MNQKIHTYSRLGVVLLVTLLLLTGCLFPKSELDKNNVPHENQLLLIQTAIDQYQEKLNGLLPIKTKPNETPIYEKYVIDFSLLKDEGLLSEIPGNAFEKGGVYQYVLIDVDDDPTVKLIDLRTTSEVQSLYVKVNDYRNKHIYPPYGESIGKDLFTIDYEKLGLSAEPTVVSPFTQNNLPIIMDVDGDLLIDYRPDLMQLLSEGAHSFENGDDIRSIFTETSSFVPAYSLPYTIEDGEPIFLIE